MATYTSYAAYARILAGTLPTGSIVDGDIDFSYRNTLLQTLPDSLCVVGSIDLEECTLLNALPEGLMVNGWLFAGGCSSLRIISEGLRVLTVNQNTIQTWTILVKPVVYYHSRYHANKQIL